LSFQPRDRSAVQIRLVLGRLDRTTWKTLNAILEQPLPALTA